MQACGGVSRAHPRRGVEEGSVVIPVAVRVPRQCPGHDIDLGSHDEGGKEHGAVVDDAVAGEGGGQQHLGGRAAGGLGKRTRAHGVRWGGVSERGGLTRAVAAMAHVRMVAADMRAHVWLCEGAGAV